MDMTERKTNMATVLPNRRFLGQSNWIGDENVPLEHLRALHYLYVAYLRSGTKCDDRRQEQWRGFRRTLLVVVAPWRTRGRRQVELELEPDEKERR